MLASHDPPNPEVEYETRLTARRERLGRETARRNQLGNARLAITVAAVAAIWIAIAYDWPWWSALAAVSFAVLIALFVAGDRVARRMQIAQRSVEYYERALERVRYRQNPRGETGERFLDPHHPYAVDLDIFGKHSLFQLLSTCRTRAGENLLARWMLTGSPAEEIASRHAAVADLRDRLDLREDLAVLGEDFRSGVNPEALEAWAVAPAVPIPQTVRYIAASFSFLGLVALALWVLSSFSDPRLRIAMVMIGVMEALVFARWRGVVNRIAGDAEAPGNDLALLAAVLARIEHEQFLSPRLARGCTALQEPRPASVSIAQLSRLIELLESRETWFVRIFGPLLLWTTQVTFALETWRQRYGHAIPRWLEAVAEFEALGSLAALRFEQPGDVLPQVINQKRLLEARDLAHPLVPGCVPNDVSLNEGAALLIVSGSNMSGKSTLLRSIGSNVVLALAGAPVRASFMRLGPLSIGASIRSSDSLEGGISRFYAEILRIRQLFDLPRPVLFLLDELLAGTNSHDRRIGAEAILQGLLERGAIGLATTHDLALSALVDALPGSANVHFEDFIHEGRMQFDYRMRPGVVTRSNALELMRSVGLKV